MTGALQAEQAGRAYIAKMLRAGHTPREIADGLRMSVATVRPTVAEVRAELAEIGALPAHR